MPVQDEELVEKARAGDLDAFGVLVRRHHAKVAGLCASMLDDPSEIDDAAQEIFLKAHKSLSSFKGGSKFTTWLYRVAANHCLDVRRKLARRKQTSLDALVSEEGASLEALLKEPDRPYKEEDADLARRMLAALPEGYREVLVLRETQGLSYEEIAEALSCSLDAVKARLKRARRDLAESLRHFSGPGDVPSSGESHGPRKR